MGKTFAWTGERNGKDPFIIDQPYLADPENRGEKKGRNRHPPHAKSARQIDQTAELAISDGRRSDLHQSERDTQA